MKIGLISLGCDKNRIDSENMLAYLQDDGYELTGEPSEADIIIINTCGFIDSAKQEAIDTILEMAEYKKDKCKYLIVTGCLAQRYMQELEKEFPEVDMFLGTANYHKLPILIKNMVGGQGEKCYVNDKDDRKVSSKRVLTTPYHYAYLKIAEGCDNKCTYCAIPNIRGKYTSRKIEDVVEEAKSLIKDYGIKELIIVAQDVSRYGID
ncbi:MAG: radical SAM protein, partial [Clostridia bacterium]|nr:radical SAM protein [Clostridia bacterium]